MKDQYFGDISDYLKYGLLRALTRPDSLRLGVCWMLTPSDTRSDGEKLGYLARPDAHRHRDPELFDFLARAVLADRDRRTARIAESPLLGSAAFQPAILTDNASERAAYFDQSSSLFADRDLIFFDPDNGLDTPSTPKGRKNSSKYLYRDEAAAAFAAGASILVYQHFIRQERAAFTARLTAELYAITRSPAVLAFHTPHVLFLLAAQPRHASTFHRQLDYIHTVWHPHINPVLQQVTR